MRLRWDYLLWGLTSSLAITLLLSLWIGPKAFLGLLALPFVFVRPQFDESPAPPACPRCGWKGESAQELYCPRDGSRLGPA